MVTQKALPSYMPKHNVILWLFPSTGGVNPFPLSQAWPVNLFVQDEAKGTCHDFHTCALKRHCSFCICFPGILSYQVQKPNFPDGSRERPGVQRPPEVCKSTRERGWFQQPNRITGHISSTSLMPAAPGQVTPAITHEAETSHCRQTLPHGRIMSR